MTKLQYKTIELKDVELKSEEDGATFSGYASVFNSNDLAGDTILPGAYKDALENFTPKMFFNHDSYNLPIGKWVKVEEDEKGLKVIGELTPGNPQSEAVKAALKHGTVDGLSIGYKLVASGYKRKKDGGRTIEKIEALPEISIVTFPCDQSARIDSKSEDIDELKTVRDFENYLRDAGGFSKAEATALCAKARAVFSDQGEPDGEEKAQKEVCERIKALAERFN